MAAQRAGCHCGRIRFEVDAPLERATVCNCSICTRTGYLHWNVEPGRVRFLSCEGEWTSYRFGTRVAINGLSNSYHPCQILADLMTIKEKKGKLDGLSLAWIGDGNNVCNSMMIGCSKVGISMSIATPKEFEPNQTLVKTCKKLINIDLSQDPQKAAKNADIIVTETFVSIHDNPKRIKKFLQSIRSIRH